MHDAFPRVAFGVPRALSPPIVPAQATRIGRTRVPSRTTRTDAVTIDPARTGFGCVEAEVASSATSTMPLTDAPKSRSITLDAVTLCASRQARRGREWYDCRHGDDGEDQIREGLRGTARGCRRGSAAADRRPSGRAEGADGIQRPEDARGRPRQEGTRDRRARGADRQAREGSCGTEEGQGAR